ncbi:hypothetical protein CLV63_103283 [Murinocardiopsis flavida]|uniref:DUF11 domain-containing protein n=1 Tax=Murinocardiopsis flavida TaxID=645275 RepID=A0A2P8DQR4_9ACTN|nr:DUF11 domain-containing protein [Murinocardiopsis flavida]PSK99558.1 hypothetical protein CLV63_103283 [Murinocardiopsis flavida]
MGIRARNWAVLLVGPALLVYCNASAASAVTSSAASTAGAARFSVAAAGSPASAEATTSALRIEATGTPVHAARGARVGYTVQAHNTGRRAVDAAVRLEDVSPGLSIAAAESDPACTVQRGGYVCTRSELNPGATASWTVYGDIDHAASGSVRAAFAQFTAASKDDPHTGEQGRGTARGTAEVATIVDASLPVASPSPAVSGTAAPHGAAAVPAPPAASHSSPAPAVFPGAAGHTAPDGTRTLPLTGGTLLGLVALAFGLLVAGATIRMLFGSRRR